jgi:hypothetical protein
MISVEEVVTDPDMASPKPFTILRSTGSWDSTGFVSQITQTLQRFGCVHQTSEEEIAMLPQADKVSEALTFWSTQPMYVTQGSESVPATHGEAPTGAFPGTVYALSANPPAETLVLWQTGDQLRENIDFTISANVITLTSATQSTDTLYATWPITALVGAAASDIIQYGEDNYRLVHVHASFGGGYWRAVGQRMSAD